MPTAANATSCPIGLRDQSCYRSMYVSQEGPHMTTWKPDPSFYPSPRMAMKAAPETLAYVAAFDPERKVPDAIAVVDVDPKSKSYSKIVANVDMPNVGDELHH